jgi:hypothetical protein
MFFIHFSELITFAPRRWTKKKKDPATRPKGRSSKPERAQEEDQVDRLRLKLWIPR